MNIQVLINNINITNHVAVDSLSITRNINSTPSECTFEIVEKTSYFGLYEFLVGVAKTDISYTASDTQQQTSNIISLLNAFLPVTILRDNIAIFSGYISTIDKTSRNGLTTYSITVLDPVSLFKRVVVENKTYTNTTVGNIVKDLISMMPNVSSDNSFIHDNTSVANWIVRMKSLDQVLSELQAFSSSYFYLDEQNRLHWNLQSNPEISSVTFTELPLSSSSKIVEGTFNITENASNIVNKVTVIASQESISDETTYHNNPTSDGFRKSAVNTTWPPNNEESSNFSVDYLDLSVNVQGQTNTASTVCDNSRLYQSVTSSVPFSLTYTTSGPSCYYGRFGDIYYAFCTHLRIPVPPIPKSQINSCKLICHNNGYYDTPNDGVGSFFVQVIDEATHFSDWTSNSLGGFEVPIGTTEVELPVSVIPDSGNYMYFKIGVGPLTVPLQPSQYNYFSVMPSLVEFQYTYYTGQTEYTTNRVYLTFDTSTIPSNATITEAKLKLYSLSPISTLPCLIEYTSDNQWNPTVEGTAVNNHLFSIGWNNLLLQNTQHIKKGSGSTIFRLRRDHNAQPTSSSSCILRSQESSFKPALEVKYCIITPGIKSTVSDSDSISQYGVRHLVVQKSEYTTVNECEQEATRLLKLYKKPQFSIRFSSTNTPSPAIGSTVLCEFPSLNLTNQYFLVVRKSERYTDTQVEFQYELNEPTEDIIQYLAKRNK